MPRFRCSQCNTSYLQDRVACDACGIDPKKDSGAAGLLVRLVTIHFDPPSGLKNRGKGHIACDPSKPVHGRRATGEPSVVNCEACRQTEAWKKAHAAAGDPEFLEDQDESVEIDKATFG